jgi:hypothetical protein
MLCDKWRLELRNRFGVEATIVDAAELASELRRPLPQFPASQAMIASMQGVRPPLDWEDQAESESSRRQLAQVLNSASGKDPLLDLVIDELGQLHPAIQILHGIDRKHGHAIGRVQGAIIVCAQIHHTGQSLRRVK